MIKNDSMKCELFRGSSLYVYRTAIAFWGQNEFMVTQYILLSYITRMKLFSFVDLLTGKSDIGRGETFANGGGPFYLMK